MYLSDCWQPRSSLMRCSLRVQVLYSHLLVTRIKIVMLKNNFSQKVCMPSFRYSNTRMQTRSRTQGCTPPNSSPYPSNKFCTVLFIPFGRVIYSHNGVHVVNRCTATLRLFHMVACVFFFEKGFPRFHDYWWKAFASKKGKFMVTEHISAVVKNNILWFMCFRMNKWMYRVLSHGIGITLVYGNEQLWTFFSIFSTFQNFFCYFSLWIIC